MSELIQAPRWYALRTHSRHEKLVRDRLAAQGGEPLLPTITELRQWKDRRKEVVVPLFPGYCFARFAWPDCLAVQKTPGVVEIVGGGDRFEPIPDEEIDALKTLMASTLRFDASPYLREGMMVEVAKGSLKGVRGLLVRKGKRHRLVIAVHLIQQAASVEMYDSDVVPV
ncbi:MAG: UpxY family transcription antiterminator [Betaproteobacteria bacterium]|nr:UpxY family transcription antiterminator [Betaproteobacteria bacterium]MBM3531252.1 UpxY family transcription antiterminator [Alphaproteobacteria bacterium]